MHKRTDIRNQAATIATGLATAGSNVNKSRFFPLQPQNMPAWVITTEDEDAELVDMGGGLERTLELVFTAVCRATSGIALEDQLDTMAEELETVVTRDAFTGVDSCTYAGSEPTFDVDETDQAVGILEIRFTVTYFTDQGAPSV